MKKFPFSRIGIAIFVIGIGSMLIQENYWAAAWGGIAFWWAYIAYQWETMYFQVSKTLNELLDGLKR